MPPKRPTDLPDFETPPVTEVVLGIQFDPIVGFTSAHAGLVWQRFRDQFPRVEDKAPLDAVHEEFGEPKPNIAPFRWELLDRPVAPRTWFLNNSGTQLVQLQRDRIVHNWRKVGQGDIYPRYETIKTAFQSDVRKLEDALTDCGLGAMRPNQWEITYVNHVALPLHEHAQTFGQVEGLIAPWNGIYSDQFLDQPEDLQLSARYCIRDDSGQAIGRLHIALQPGVRREDERHILILTLTARGRPLEPTSAFAFEGLDIGRLQIVRGFTSITTPSAHHIWGRKDA